MLLIKTLRARDAIQDKHSALTTRQRQILILCDGKRTSEQLVELMGAEISADIAHLMRLRFLVWAEEVRKAENSGFGESAHGEMWDLSEFNEGDDLPSQFRNL